jgi:chlorophyll synthase
MTLNDFKALEGDRATGVRSLPVVVGPEVAAKIACTVMALPQMIVISMLFIWGCPVFAAVVLASLLAQFWAMRVMMRDPKAKAPWYNATGVTLYVSGMMVTAFAIRTLELAP